MTKRAVVLAGGKGSRLAPYTTVLPKPLLPVGDEAILDVVLRQLRFFGFHNVTLAVGHLSHLIRAVIGDGSKHEMKVEYHEEAEPLGTVGPLATIAGLDEPFLVMNGDVLTSLDYDELFEAHCSAGRALTVAAHLRTVPIDYGVLHVSSAGGAVRAIEGYDEKPELSYTVSMGVYIFDPRALEHVEEGEYMDLPDLVLKLIAAGESVGAFVSDGFWLDIGRHDDYEQAIAEFDRNRPLLLHDESDRAGSEDS